MFNGYKITNVLTTNPYEWKCINDGPQSVKSVWKKLAWRLHAFLNVAQAIFAASQCWRLNIEDNGNTTHKIYMVFSALFYSFGVWLQLANWGNQTNLPRFVRGYTRFFRNVECKQQITKCSFMD